jgi:glucosylglycerol 3-phosphatase
VSVTSLPLHQQSLSLDHQALIEILARTENLIVIQDLDGVCMGLVRDPLTRSLAPEYLQATRSFDGHFFVLTNGEHIGKRGVNKIVERAILEPNLAREEGLYLPGLAGGGVQWQDRYGNVSHPGVSDAELNFLQLVPQAIATHLREILTQKQYKLTPEQRETAIAAAVLDNLVSPTVNLNIFYEILKPNSYAELQQEIRELTEALLVQAEATGLKDAFFIHYAPNLGRDSRGLEIMQPATEGDSGTTDFQFMLRGAIKEVGVLVILNHYYYLQTGNYPLGEDFNARQAPQRHPELIDLVKANFDPEIMPTIVGVGDTVTSKAVINGDLLEFKRGGSDRGFLELVQALGKEFNTGNIVTYIDSSGGEVKNRKPLKLAQSSDRYNSPVVRVVEGPGDSRDTTDTLTLNVVFPQGYEQYIEVFATAARLKKVKS